MGSGGYGGDGTEGGGADSHAGFPETDWARLAAIRAQAAAEKDGGARAGGGGDGNGAPQRAPEMDGALRAYWSPVYAYIRRTGKNRADAEELTQEFVRQVVLGRSLFARADADKAKFRTFLRAALRNFLVDMATSKAAKARHLERSISADVGTRGGVVSGGVGFPEPAENDDPDLAFDRQWAAGLLTAALDRTKAHCDRSGLVDHWRLFEMAYIEPLRRGTGLVDGGGTPAGEGAGSMGSGGGGHAGHAAAMGLDPSKAESMVQTVRRVFKRTFRAVVAETVKEGGGEDRVEEEIRYVFAALGLAAGG